MEKKNKIRVVELFAGVGGFRLGLERESKSSFSFLLSNQWEPKNSSSSQHAYQVLKKNFCEDTILNEDIFTAKDKLPKNFDLLVGGFPCQDYSVATVKASGIEGKKGVLWWDISYIVNKHKPKVLFFENVDRLLKSPRDSPGRDFAIILKNLDSLGYDVEWSVINAADYGFYQRRKRIFIICYRKELKIIKDLSYISENSIFNKAFPRDILYNKKHSIDLNKYKNEKIVTQEYNGGMFNIFGIMKNGIVQSYSYSARSNVKQKKLSDILESNWDKISKYELDKNRIANIKKLKDGSKTERIKDGYRYFYSVGKMNLYDDLNKPSRTILTSEGSVNRSTHVIKQKIGNKTIVRSLTPVETERLNGFPDNWTEGIPERYRYFCMGNALVVDIISMIGKEIVKVLKK